MGNKMRARLRLRTGREGFVLAMGRGSVSILRIVLRFTVDFIDDDGQLPHNYRHHNNSGEGVESIHVPIFGSGIRKLAGAGAEKGENEKYHSGTRKRKGNEWGEKGIATRRQEQQNDPGKEGKDQNPDFGLNRRISSNGESEYRAEQSLSLTITITIIVVNTPTLS